MTPTRKKRESTRSQNWLPGKKTRDTRLQTLFTLESKNDREELQVPQSAIKRRHHYGLYRRRQKKTTQKYCENVYANKLISLMEFINARGRHKLLKLPREEMEQDKLTTRNS